MICEAGDQGLRMLRHIVDEKEFKGNLLIV